MSVDRPADDESLGLSVLVDHAVRAHGPGVVLAADEAGIVPLLVAHPAGLTAMQTSDQLGLNAPMTAAVLPVLVALGVLTVDGTGHTGRYRATELAARHLDPKRDTEYGGGWLRALHRVAGGTDRVGECLTGQRALSTGMFTDSGGEVLTGLVAAYGPLGAADGQAFTRRVDVSGCRRVLDVGIGTAGYTIAILRAAARARVVGFDLPQMIGLVRQRVERAGFADRVDLLAGNVITDDLPPGFDTVLLNNVLHNWDPQHRTVALEHCFGALEHGGRLFVSEHMRDETLPDGQGDVAALMGLLVLMQGGRGGAYTIADHEAAVRAAGFVEVTTVPFPGQAAASHLLSARKP